MYAETDKIPEEMILTCAHWWADQLGCPKFDNGATERASVVASMLATMNTQPVSDEQRDKFIEAVKEHFKDATFSGSYNLKLNTDYGANDALSKCMQIAGIHSGNAPWKTRSRFELDGFYAQAGYGAPSMKIEPYVKKLMIATSDHPIDL